ncbi:hypothetical protein ACLQ2P_39990 [Actinomadura citrea]|uniref:hypothetical protein n=1 Tax=Actinomadura citrea TaxID=46158 RepID=UPI003CE4C419
MKRALLPIPAAQSSEAFRYGPISGAYQQLTDRIANGKTWQSEPCADRTMMPNRIQALGEQARFSPAALAMWTDEARALFVTETIIKLTEANAHQLVATPAPEECHAYDIVIEGENHHVTLRADEFYRRGGGPARVQIWEHRIDGTTSSVLQLISRRGNYVIILSLSPNGRIRLADYRDIVTRAEDHAATVLRQDEGSRT